MNRHNFHQFNPNCYRKHLSPFGRNVLDTLVKYWRPGFDNNESRHRQQHIPNQNRRNTREFPNCPRSIPSVPTSPAGEIPDDRGIYQTINLDSNNYLIPELPLDRDSYSSTTPFGQAEYEKDVYHAPFNSDNDNFAMPRLPVGSPSEPSKHVVTHHEKDLRPVKPIAKGNSLSQQHDTRDEKQHFSNTLPNVTIRQVSQADTHNKLPAESVLTSGDLAKTVGIANTNEEEILTANDMITPVINLDNINENLLSSTNKNINKIGDPTMPAKKFLEILNKETIKVKYPIRDEVINHREDGVTKNVDWNDMFDTELFPDLKDPPQLMLPLEDARHNHFKIDFPKDKKRKPNKIGNKVTKAKTELKTNNKALSKQVKKITCEPNNLENIAQKTSRKANYTKAVKNWLDGIETNNLLQEEIDEPMNNSASDIIETKIPLIQEMNGEKNYLKDRNNAINKYKQVEINIKPQERMTKKASVSQIRPKVNGKEELIINDAEDTNESKPTIHNDTVIFTNSTAIVIEKKPKSKSKKTVQTRLAEKDGIMKFGPPVKGENESTTEPSENKETKNKETKEKKFKVKFLPPIKSQIPVKNVTFDVHTIDESNVHLIHDMNNSEDNEEIAMVIVYSKSSLGLAVLQIGASLIDPDNPPENFAELQNLLGFTPEYTIATECVLHKAAWYTTLLKECFDKLKSMLMENSVWNVFSKIEMPLLPVIAGMEYQGVCVDFEKIKAMEDILLTKMKAVEQECYKAAGKTFQINSTVQVRTILYDELQLDTKSNLKIKETIGKGAKSTSETMLRGLVSVHPLPRLILEYRHLHKAHATFLTGIAQHVKDGMVKPTWEQMAAATGRIASNNPNLQAIPKAPFTLVVFPENSDEQEPTLNFRSVYTARPQHLFLAADFKHIECRVFAHAAEDATLQDALRSGQDLFRVLAAKWLNKPVEDVSTEDRERTKRIVYASLYGAGARKLMEILHIGYEQALSVMISFNRTFPALKSFGRAVVARAARGRLRSLCGRARRFPHIASAEPGLRAQAERQAVNFVVQGSAADLCKRAMVSVQRRLSLTALRCRLVLQIHDELVWEVADGDVDLAAAIIKEAMENVGRECGMGMTLPVELTHGRNWGEMKPLPSPDF